MKRYKSIDIVRGIAIMGMVFGHLLNWWLIPEDYWLYLFIYYSLGPIAAGGFLFISGISAILAYKKSIIMLNKTTDFNIKMIRNTYLLRALLLLLISFLYNTAIAVAINNYSWIWAWFVLQTIGFSLLLAWPFLKTSKSFRIIFGLTILILNFYILELLAPYQGQTNLFGIFYHILFNPLDLYPIIPFFVLCLFGTVIGDILYDINAIQNKNERAYAFKFKFIYPIFLIGISLTIFSVIYKFPDFFKYWTFSAIVYALGIIFIIVSVIIGIEEFELIKFKKNYNLFFYYSYYSFTVFIAHNLLYFLFYQSLNAVNIWIALVVTLFFLTLLLRYVYQKIGPKASIKVGISILSLIITIKFEQRKNLRIGKFESALKLGKLLKFGNERKD